MRNCHPPVPLLISDFQFARPLESSKPVATGDDFLPESARFGATRDDFPLAKPIVTRTHTLAETSSGVAP
jgi:hypothetical protein